MAQNLSQSGLLSLDPMQYWKNVLNSNNLSPVFLVVAEGLNNWEYVLDILREHPCCKMVIEATPASGLPNALFRSVGKTFNPDSVKEIDYIFCEEHNYKAWIPAMLSGATPIFKLKDLEAALQENRLPSKIERVENFEKAREALDNLLML